MLVLRPERVFHRDDVAPNGARTRSGQNNMLEVHEETGKAKIFLGHYCPFCQGE